MEMKTVRVLSDFYFEKRIMQTGQTIELPALFAGEMCAAKKAELIDDLVGAQHAAPLQSPPVEAPVEAVSVVGEAEPPKPKGRKAHAE